jgi:hypothetical protein
MEKPATSPVPASARPGAYLGTVVDGKWWKRFRRYGFFARGNGVFWYDGEGFHFRRYLTTTSLTVPFRLVTGITTGTSHAGRWLMGARALKIVWRRDGLALSSGYIVSRTNDETEAIASELRTVCGLKGETA